MNLDLQTLSSDALIYMLLHSSFFVLILGLAFFIIGMLFGRATWGRYKQQARNMAAEIEMQRGELATLKRKLGEHAVRAGNTPMATETFATPHSMTAAAPEAAAATATMSPSVSSETLQNPSLPATDSVNAPTAEKTKAPRHKNLIKVKSSETMPQADPVAEIPLSNSTAPSPLAAIIAPHPPALTPKDKPPTESLATASAMMDVIPALPELPATAQPAEITPELDPRLGLIFKSRPPQSDDLTAMKGIAKVLEQRLHEFGIYTYQQIALWDENQIKEFSSRLAFKDRIHREKWVEQAKHLHQEKHGGAL